MSLRASALATLLVAALHVAPAVVGAQTFDHRVLATSKTSTMQKEMQEAGESGYRFVAVMGGDTAMGGKEVVVVMVRTGADATRFEYRLLATSRTSTMERELQDASDAGYTVVGQTVFESLFGGKEVATILERDPGQTAKPAFQYRLVATNKTSTMQKELQQLGEAGYQAVAMTVGSTALGGNELVVVTRRPLQ